jgi:hypothetical protein
MKISTGVVREVARQMRTASSTSRVRQASECRRMQMSSLSNSSVVVSKPIQAAPISMRAAVD